MTSKRSTCVASLLIVLASGAASAQSGDLYDLSSYRSIYLTFSQPDWWNQLLANYAPEIEIPADMVVDGLLYPGVGVRFRGNTSYTQLPPGSEKKSFNIRTDSFTPGQEIMGYDHLNLNNGFHDPTFVREVLAYMVCREYGPAPKANFVKLYLNGQYWGVYVNVQQPNKDMMAEWFRSNDGNRYRCFPTSGSFGQGQCAFTWLGANVQSYLNSYQAKQGDGTDLMQMCDVLNNTPAATHRAAVDAIFSVDTFYRYAACMNVMTNTDSYIGTGKDHYLYHDPVYGAFHTFPFDLNEALSGSTTLSPFSNTTSTIKPGFSRTLVYPDWNERYIAHYRTIVEDTFNWPTLGPIINGWRTLIDADVAADLKKIYTYTQFQTNFTAPVSVASGGFGGTTTIPGLQPLIEGRRTWLATQTVMSGVRATLSNLTHAPISPTPNDTITYTVQADTTATSVTLFHHFSGPFVATPMFDDGNHGDGSAGDGTWGLIVAAYPPGSVVEYYAAAATSTGKLSFLPRTGEQFAPSFEIAWPTAASPLRINEFVAQNTMIPDNFGEFEDYVEIYNDSAATVSLGGLYMTDNLTNPTKWQIPVGQTIAPFGTVLIWCDEDLNQGDLHADFKLSTGGESVSLFASDGITQLDSFVFGQQVANVATGRLDDGFGPWVTLNVPTPNLLNRGGCGIRTYTSLLAAAHTMDADLQGTPSIGASVTLTLASGPTSGVAIVFASPASAYELIPSSSAVVLVNTGLAVWFAAPLDVNGDFSVALTLPNLPWLVGQRVFVQGGALDGSTVTASNAFELTFCP